MSFCGGNAILKTIEPDFRKGAFRRIFVCVTGHEFIEEVDLQGEKRWVKEILEELKEK